MSTDTNECSVHLLPAGGVRRHFGSTATGSPGVSPPPFLHLAAERGRRDGAQVESLQEGSLDVPLEMEEEAHAPLAEEAPEDAPALEVRQGMRRPSCTEQHPGCILSRSSLVQPADSSVT